MGHLRLGRLPKTRRWIEVVDLLDDAPLCTCGITIPLSFQLLSLHLLKLQRPCRCVIPF